MKTKTVVGIVLALVVIGAGVYWWRGQQTSPPDYKNITYVIEEKPVTLVNGHAQVANTPDSSSKTVTDYFGNLAKGDLNGDTIPDLAFLITQNGGGSGTFFYVVAALQTPDGGYQGTNAILLGDRIAPQTTEISNGQIIVNYADRKEGEPYSASPSVGVSKYLKVNGTRLYGIVP
jgi:hypothetical protein